MSIGDIGDQPGGGLRFSSRRGRTLSGTQAGQRYPSPFFDIAQTYLPTSIKSMFSWLRFYFLTNPLINAVVTKMAQYPITSISYDTQNEDLKKKWEYVLDDMLDFQSFQEGVGLDYYTYGNCFVSISFPLRKYLKCAGCQKLMPISDVAYKFRDYEYLMICKHCGHDGPAIVMDRYIRSLKGTRLIRWGPENMGVSQNVITGEVVYTYAPPVTLKNDILMGKPEVVEQIPHVFVEALRVNKAIQFTPDAIMHLKRPNLAEQDQGWGMPLAMPVLKDAHYLQVLKKAQEAIAHSRIVPLEILFPQPSTSTGDPYSLTDLSNWASKVEQEIARWKFDSNYIPIMPLPIGHQMIGGDGRALILHQEIRLWSEQIVTGMGVPVEFVFGGASWTGSNVSLRMIENLFLKYRRQQLRLLKWTIAKISLFMGIPPVPVHFTDFKMADDLQRKQLLINLASMNKISDRTLLDEFEYDYADEKKQIEGQLKYDSEYQKHVLISQAEAQGEASLVTAKYQQKLQEAMGQAGAQGVSPGQDEEQQQPGTDARQIAAQYAQKLSGMPKGQQQQIMAAMQKKYPNLANTVAGLMGQGGETPMPNGQSLAVSKSSTKPLPQSRPPRRVAAAV